MSNSIILHKDKIEDKIQYKGLYTDKDIKIKPWENDTEADEVLYLCEINKGDGKYIGIINSDYKRYNIGLNKYTNGDIYLGKWQNDKKSKHGIYLYAPQKKDIYICHELFQGLWKGERKDNHGLYVWKFDDSNNHNVFIELFVGAISNDDYTKGLYFYHQNEQDSVYYGMLNAGNKADNEGYFYNKDEDIVMIGDVSGVKFNFGYEISFTGDEVKVQKFIYEYSKKICTPCENDEIKEKALEFRALIQEDDYFSEVVTHYDKVKKSMDVNIEMFEGDGYAKIVDSLSSYNKFYRLYNTLMKSDTIAKK
jgi:hypothetical protein